MGLKCIKNYLFKINYKYFVFRYLKQRNTRVEYTKKDRDSDMESIASDDFEDMLKGMVGSSKKDLDFADDVADNLKKTKKTKGKKESGRLKFYRLPYSTHIF